MAKETNYIVVVKKLENEKYLISFPDFEGMTTVSETAEAITELAANTIKIKLNELKKLNLEIIEPKKIDDIILALKEGEFTSIIPISNFSFDFKSLKDKGTESLKNINASSVKEVGKNIEGKLNDVINKDIKERIPEGKENILGIIGGILLIISVFISALIKVKIPFFGKVGIKYFSGLSDFSMFAEKIKTADLILKGTGIFVILVGIFIIYSSYKKEKDNMLISIYVLSGLLILQYIYIFIKIMGFDANIRKAISFGVFKVILYIISVALIYISANSLKKLDN